MTPATGTGLGIPRLQELEYLETAMRAVVEGKTYDGVRVRLIAHMEVMRRDSQQTGNHAGRRHQTGGDPERARYFNNATVALNELMHLGYVERDSLPSTKKALPEYRDRTFTATDAGREWAAMLADPPRRREGYDELLTGLWRIHPQLSGYLRLISKADFQIPTAGWQEVHPEPIQGDRTDAEAAYVVFLADRCVATMKSTSLGWKASRDEIISAITSSLARVADRAISRGRDPFPKARDYHEAVEEGLGSFAFAQAGVEVDFITVEILRRWARSLGVGGFSYHVPGTTALTLWRTATITERGDELQVERPTVAEYGDRIVEEIVRVHKLASDERGAAFVPIFMVRAGVCSRLKVPDALFDRVLIEMVRGERASDLPRRLHLDQAQEARSLPPAEKPLFLPSKGRQRAFYLMGFDTRPNRRRDQ